MNKFNDVKSQISPLIRVIRLIHVMLKMDKTQKCLSKNNSFKYFHNKNLKNQLKNGLKSIENSSFGYQRHIIRIQKNDSKKNLRAKKFLSFLSSFFLGALTFKSHGPGIYRVKHQRILTLTSRLHLEILLIFWVLKLLV